MALPCSKRILELLKAITSKRNGGCLNCLHSFRTENNSGLMKKDAKLNIFYGIVIKMKKTQIFMNKLCFVGLSI